MASYRELRGQTLEDYCTCVATVEPDASLVVGIATEGAESESRSFDLVLVDPRDMTEEDRDNAREVARAEGWFERRTISSGSEDEYPSDRSGGERFSAGRNDPCPCGSGRKFKRCHGRNDRR